MENIAQDSQFAAEYSTNVDVDQIAEVYAAAYLNAVKNSNNSVEKAVEEFASLANILQSNDKFNALLASAMITAEEKITLLEKTIKNSVSDLFMNFLKVTARRNRLGILNQIYQQTRIALNKQHKRIPVVITTATEIEPSLLKTLSEKLEKIIGGKPIIRNIIDPSAIGGLIIRIGDTVYDASLQTQLNSVRKQIIEKSAQEIQTKHNNFQNE
ncbi:MAG: ATP synthase F1 subunit delta [Planctomycetaceae bacterium]|jgi:F-type H+-transporting ATPase subunit delta|nr:ATP synthase F1 subunit delta [Planctomycetaceae bacterium]